MKNLYLKLEKFFEQISLKYRSYSVAQIADFSIKYYA